MNRNEGTSTNNPQYFGYVNHKSEDELSSVSVGMIFSLYFMKMR